MTYSINRLNSTSRLEENYTAIKNLTQWKLFLMHTPFFKMAHIILIVNRLHKKRNIVSEIFFFDLANVCIFPYYAQLSSNF